MISIVAHTENGQQELGPSSLAALEPALSYDTRQIARRLEALRNRPTPASLLAEDLPTSRENPPTERLFDALAEVKILTSRVAMHLDAEWRKKLFHQLDSLHDPAEWDNDDQPIQQASFATFLKAMLDVNPERRPGIGLSSAGHLIAAWTMDRDRLTIEFLPDDRVRWVLSQRYRGETEHFAGETSVSRLIGGLASHHPDHWFSHAQDLESA